MAFWSRLKQSKPRFCLALNEFKRYHVSNRLPNVSNLHISSRVFIPVSNNPSFTAPSSQLELFHNVRFYAAPFKVDQKEEKEKKGPRLNEEITTQFVRLVGDEGHNVVSRNDALARAKSLDMDLVEVDKNARPPVCKIMDYNKERYLQQMKEKEKGRAKNKSELKKGDFKEVRFAAKIKQNDLKIKADMVKRLMENGNRVKCTAVEPTSDMDLETLLSRFCALIEDVAIVESEPKVEKKQAFVVVRHVKFGPAKKGSGKKASKAAEPTTTTTSKETVSSSEEKRDNTVEASSETNHEASSEDLSEEEDSGIKKSERAVFDGGDDYMVQKQAPSRSSDGARNPYQIPFQQKQPQLNINASSQFRPNQQGEGIPKQDSPRSSIILNSPTKNYGIFSTQRVDNTQQGQKAAVQTNRYQKKDPSGSATGVSPNRNPSAQDPRINCGPGLDNPRQGRWGSNVVPNKKNENQAEIHRR